jgi:cytochrome c-type biogenesis protein CcmE
MKIFRYSIIFLYCLTLSAFANPRYFLFPGEAIEFSSKYDQNLNIFGIVNSIKSSDNSDIGYEFKLLDRSNSVTVIYDSYLPELFGPGIPAVISGKFKNDTFVATTILLEFSSDFLPEAALNELKSYGVMIEN